MPGAFCYCNQSSPLLYSSIVYVYEQTVAFFQTNIDLMAVCKCLIIVLVIITHRIIGIDFVKDI